MKSPVSWVRLGSAVAPVLALCSCLSVPPEIIQLHEKEALLAAELNRTQVALIDGFVDERLRQFEAFYFSKYAPRYLENWKAEFARVNKRAFNEASDFGQLHPDLVAEYLDKIKPIEKMRAELKAAVNEAYSQYHQSYTATHAWLQSAKKLNDGQRGMINRIAARAHPSLSLDAIEEKITELQNSLK